MPTEKEVYEKYADEYERLIEQEDYQENLLQEIENLVSLVNLDVADFGAGTGRLTRLLAPHIRSKKWA
ncbi:MAG: hypothetical protein HN736_10545 [Anaerolineae bacterium]|jgi:ubiquinone/menaquinone biosynthesis C-methylase UbiE|nr:hypothetical protein [Anaerolineae bacterium]MBT4311431.1 hypothetical protein [Anaerolineae bacterium]MBT4459158.1 hypothetical protein [Anaerolineae bacterium]MBT4841477.1 hypothetical protein [Anaerolineae bacterium]MBT6061624.1 hypothetical protein [Anaerolineae bacterium]